VGGDSGYIAHFVLFRYAGKTLGVINTHLTWDPPGTALAAQRGLLQIQQLLAEYATCSTDAEGWILCGDFNVTPDSAVVDAVAQAGFQFSHRGLSEVFSCNIGSSARLIDYIFFSPRLSAKAAVLTRIDDQTILPSADEPSDHVPVKAAVTWQS
jgi:endonuclease/exonuclease/phosphatase family metal-dependent hydrolase